MRNVLLLGLVAFCATPLFSQTPQAGFVYEDRSGTTGHTIVTDGKSYGPYKDLSRAIYSTHGRTGFFLVTKRDKTYILAQGKESGPFPPGFSDDRSWISDDGKFWAVTTLQESTSDDGNDTSQSQLWVNGKAYGPYTSVESVEYAEAGGSWIASVKTSDENWGILVNGKSQGTFTAVDQLWMSADGSLWGYVATKEGDQQVAVTQDKSYTGYQDANFSSMDPKAPHWAYAVRTGDEDETVVVDGKSLSGYLHFQDFVVTGSGRHWGFSADKLTDSGDYPVVVIDGTEYVGEGLSDGRQGAQEFFTWTVQDGPKTTVQLLAFP